MKLLRIKITDPTGFRSLPCGFEHHFRSEEVLEDELAKPEDFAPFVCAGPNGSGKSNLLEALAAIFFQLEILRVRRSFLPEVLQNADEDFSPVAFELDYLIRVPSEYIHPDGPVWAKVSVWKNTGESVRFFWDNQSDFDVSDYEAFEGGHADFLMPQYVVGYSSGENEILSLPFFKLRFVQFDEYWNALTQQLSYPGYPEIRLAYLDNGFSQAILLCNLLFQNEATLQPFREDVGIEGLREFRIILKRRIEVSAKQAAQSTSNEYISSGYSQDSYFVDNPAISLSPETGAYTVNLMHLMEGDERSSIIEKLKRCATLSYQDNTTDTLILDYWVNEATREAFHDNFDGSPLSLFQAFQVLLVLNLYSVSDSLKADIYRSQSHYVSETVPTLASDERAMRFKHVYLKKKGISKPMLLKELSDGEHQLLHSLGLCLLFRNTNSLFLLDEPETHFNPAWRASFISRLRDCLQGQAETSQEMLITTHSPFLISDSKSSKVLVFEKNPENHAVNINHPNYNTLGASINKITNETFEKSETIGERARQILGDLLRGHLAEDDPTNLAKKIMDTVGESIERTLAVHALLHSDQKKNNKEEQD
ncbi:restriction system-associated AAA family ATPase [Pseudomonas fluorescens]|uniref:restriction system-associated AAA family ATPase n=1 Tax=Pseudomonas fluorescens TaxID=294 RepID=UPI0017850D14|nr:restriction system-associated AAA family ATPase [Pseudomonas fluorescens]MBD8191489.1 restriction system-associated AAA family ATPase [Pseudomonas fluorescens]MBD8225526.1 restriction system-associated AAA family ATPase [Pseudomonas fluorescens]MBD8783238.1 restriction system-associated AAA family ATPase [Pseudomonas fluorescens]MBD8816660.1 restriction system-associated AAA family ATPase [Pseudomonas fluorescens]